uniref:Microtubule-associated proteins 1A/1B light chain 3C n=1 Tax=Chrysemys picta bellii TaxID=8478 RepID=A0A8C3HLM2_CHRPI
MLCRRSSSDGRSFKQRKSLGKSRGDWGEMPRGEESWGGGPGLAPVVVERYRKEKQLPLLDRTKFLVSQDSSMSQFVITLRTRMSLTATQAFYLLVNKGLPSMSMTVGEVYSDHKDEDGFLYVTYASQEMFGCCCLHGPAVTQS